MAFQWSGLGMETKKWRGWPGLLGKIALVLLPAMITSYYGYRSAKIQAQAAVDMTKSQASAGYEVLIYAVEKLTTRVDTITKDTARLDGLCQDLRERHHQPISTPIATPPELKIPPTFKKPLPKNLDSAYKMKQQQHAVDF